MSGLVLCDAEGALVAWINSMTGTLVGVGKPLTNGVHHGARGPGVGTWAQSDGTTFRQGSDVADQPRLALSVKAKGGQIDGGPRMASFRAAKALALAIDMPGGRVLVTTKSGEQVLILACTDIDGPVYSGDLDGEQTHTITCVLTCQPA